MTITNKNIFDEITKLRLEMKSDLKDLRDEVDNNTSWRNQVTGKLTILFLLVGIGVNFAMDWIRNKLSQ